MIFNGISPDIMKYIFPLNRSSIYDIRNRETIYTRPAKSLDKGTESLSFFTHEIWEFIPECIKPIHSLPFFKIAINNESLMAVLADPAEDTFHKLALCRGCISSNFYAYL